MGNELTARNLISAPHKITRCRIKVLVVATSMVALDCLFSDFCIRILDLDNCQPCGFFVEPTEENTAVFSLLLPLALVFLLVVGIKDENHQRVTLSNTEVIEIDLNASEIIFYYMEEMLPLYQRPLASLRTVTSWTGKYV